MESVALKIDERIAAMQQWLTASGLAAFNLQPMLGDASFRRYFRIHTPQGSWVAMDAPPVKENCHSYVAIANALRKMQLNTPEIIAADLNQGFLLLTDMGDTTYLQALTIDNADQYYELALDALSVLQGVRMINDYAISSFNSEFMWKEWASHKEWFLDKLLGLTFSSAEEKLDACFHQLVESAISQPQVFMHRDYHSANLMLLPSSPEWAVGILDFQDALWGPVTYDLVSLLRDCYVSWPRERVEKWALSYRDKLSKLGVLSQVDASQFLRWFDWMGIERHLKALFTFARKHVRDQQSSYLQHIPRTLHYLLTVSERYPELQFLHHYFKTEVEPACETMLCAE